MKLHVEVTQEDIDLGCVGDPWGERGGCMVHRAFMRATEGAFPYIGVSSGGVNIYSGPQINAEVVNGLDFPAGVGARIARFDGGLTVKPFSFDIDIPLPGEADRFKATETGGSFPVHSEPHRSEWS